MSQATVDFYFDVVCPYAYLAFTQLDGLLARHSFELRYKPILLGGLYRVIGAGDGPMPSMPPAKAKLNLLDMHRWAAFRDQPLNMPATHPNRTVLAMRTVLASGDYPRAGKALYAAYWVRGEDVSQPEVVRAALDGAGFDGAALVEAASDPAIKQQLFDAVDEAAAAGAFGVPTFVVKHGDRSEMFWGQDRIAMVEAELAAAAA